MIRELLIAVFFFFAPALLMLMLRNVVQLLLLWMKNRRDLQREPEIIDITPVSTDHASRWFYVVVIVISLISAVLVFQQLQQTEAVSQHHYVPAHMGASGKIVSGQWKDRGLSGKSNTSTQGFSPQSHKEHKKPDK